MGGGLLGGQVGREGEVSRVGVLHDSYKLLPERQLLCSTAALGCDRASIDVKTFSVLPCWEVQSYRFAQRVGVPDTWPTSTYYFCSDCLRGGTSQQQPPLLCISCSVFTHLHRSPPLPAFPAPALPPSEALWSVR